MPTSWVCLKGQLLVTWFLVTSELGYLTPTRHLPCCRMQLVVTCLEIRRCALRNHSSHLLCLLSHVLPSSLTGCHRGWLLYCSVLPYDPWRVLLPFHPGFFIYWRIVVYALLQSKHIRPLHFCHALPWLYNKTAAPFTAGGPLLVICVAPSVGVRLRAHWLMIHFFFSCFLFYRFLWLRCWALYAGSAKWYTLYVFCLHMYL